MNGYITVGYFSTILEYDYKDILKMDSINLTHRPKRKIFDIKVQVIKFYNFKKRYVIFKDIKEKVYKIAKEIENKNNK